MEIFEIKNLSFQYPETDERVLENISLQILEGQFLVICGPSGCGKTTFLRLLKKELAPIGERNGEIFYLKKQFSEWDEKTLAEEIGFVFQDPENQIVMEEVLQEIVFGMENFGYSHVEMRKRVAELVHFFGMESLLKKKTSELSGGQKQMLNLLSVLLLKPKVLLLDEPTAQLDPVAAKEFITMLKRLNVEMGMTIVIAEHRLEELFSIADKVIFLKEGKVAYEGDSREVIDQVYRNQDRLFLPYIPSLAHLYLKKEKIPHKEKIPLSVKESKEWLSNLSIRMKKRKQPLEKSTHFKTPYLSLRNVYFQYDRHSPMVIKNLSIDIAEGEFFVLVGGNGSGKSTFIKLCLGILKAQRGSIKLAGQKLSKLKRTNLLERVAYLPQNPETFFMQDTIEKEMIQTVEKYPSKVRSEKISEMLDLFHIRHLRNRHPYDCSGGELQRAALACMLLSEPNILFIDEPTKGLDPIAKENLAKILRRLHEKGITIVMVTHDIEFAAKYADRCAMMFDGNISIAGTPNELFKGNYFYTTTMNRATRMSPVPEVLTLEEALIEW